MRGPAVIAMLMGLVLGICARHAAAAPIIYDGGTPNREAAVFADASYLYTNVAELFVLQLGATTITDAHWWGVCAFAEECPDGTFTLSFYEDNGGSVGSLIQSYSVGSANQTAIGTSLFDVYPEYAYSADFAPLTLSANTTYWFGVSNSTNGAGWAMETTGVLGAGFAWQFKADDSAWVGDDPPNDLAFNLTGTATAPEPMTLSLLGLGVLGVAARRRIANARSAERSQHYALRITAAARPQAASATRR